MAKKSWGGAGAWAADVELAESQQQQEQQPQNSPFANDPAFPSLGEAVSSKTSKKKKAQPVPLSQFMYSESKGLTPDEMMMLPTGPRDRSGEEPSHGGLGGGFRDYGGYRGDRGDRDRDSGFGGGRRSERESGFGRGGGFSGDRERDRESDEPSRADSVDDWGATKKFVPNRPGDDDHGGRRSSRYNDFPSKADEDSHWGSSKKFVPAPPSGTERRSSSKYDFSSSRNGADEVDNWTSTKRSVPPSNGGYDSGRDRDRDRDFGAPREASDADKWRRDAPIRAPSSGVERPKLFLQPRTRPVESSPPPPASKDGSDSQLNSGDVKPRKANPFGEAKPREVILEEKGLDWKKLDEELEQKTADKTALVKEEIKTLQESIKIHESELEKSEQNADVTQTLEQLKDQLSTAQKRLEQLALEGANERPSSSSGKRDNGRGSDAWTKHPSNGRQMPERKGARW